MEMFADYIMVSDSELDNMIVLNEDQLLSRLEQLTENDDAEIHSLDELWDGMHFLLTGKSAQDPIDDDELSAAVVGAENFDTEDSFVACIEKEQLEDVVKEMEKVNMDRLWEKRKLSDFRKKKIYPETWNDEDLDDIKAEMSDEFNDLLDFYRLALKKNMNIVIYIG